MLRVERLSFDAHADAGSVPYVAAGAALAADIRKTGAKLANPDFVARAPEEVVDENRERLEGAEASKARLEAALKRLEAVG